MAQASNAPGMTSATRRDEARRKRIQVLQLRAAGESFDAIAQLSPSVEVSAVVARFTSTKTARGTSGATDGPRRHRA